MLGRRDRRIHALLALPLVLAVVLVSMCLPVTCSAETMAAGRCPDCASTGAGHSPMPVMPTQHDQGSPSSCTHMTNSNVQAPASELQARAASIVALLPAAHAAATSDLPLVRPVIEHSSPPPAILNTAANLRV